MPWRGLFAGWQLNRDPLGSTAMRSRLTIGLLVLAAVLLANSSRIWTASAQIKMLEAALEAFRMDNGRYPTTEESLSALIGLPAAWPSAVGPVVDPRRLPD